MLDLLITMFNISKTRTTFLAAATGLVLFASATVAQQDSKTTFDDHVKPIFQQRCSACHNGDKQSGGLDLSNYTNMMQGGGSGQSVEPGDAGSSYLYMLVTHTETPVMPPDGTKIPGADIKTIESWINAGALENKGSKSTAKKTLVAMASPAVGTRPESVVVLPRMSLEPYFHTAKVGITNSIATSPWAPLAAIATPRQILLYDTRTRSYIGGFPFPEGQANKLRFSRNGELLIAGGGRHGLAGKVVIWDIASAERIAEIGDEVDNVLATDIRSDHARIALGGPQKMLRVYSTSDRSLAYETNKHTDWITAVAFSPDGVLLASADRNGGLHIWEAESGNEYLTLAGHSESITGLSWRPDGNVLASAGNDGAIRLWEMENGSQTKTWAAHANGTNCIQFTHDGNIVSTGRDSLVKLWQQDGKLLKQFKGQGEMGIAVAWCDETKQVIASSLKGTISVWNSSDGARVGNLKPNPPTLADRITFSKRKLLEAKSTLAPIEKQLEVATEQQCIAQKSLDEKSAVCDEAENNLTELRDRLAAVINDFNSSSAAREAWQQEVDESEQAIPLVKSAAESAATASKLVPHDIALKQSSEQLALRHESLITRVAQLKQQILDSAKGAESRANEIVELEKIVSDATLRFSNATAQFEKMTAVIQPILQKRKELESKVAAAQKPVEKFRRQVQRWNQEISFHKQLNARLQSLEEARIEIESRHVDVLQAQKAVDAAASEYQAKLSARKKSEDNAAKIEEELRILRTKK